MRRWMVVFLLGLGIATSLQAQTDFPWVVRVIFERTVRAGVTPERAPGQPKPAQWPAVPPNHALIEVDLLFSHNRPVAMVDAPVVRIRDARNAEWRMLAYVTSGGDADTDLAATTWLKSGNGKKPGAVAKETVDQYRGKSFNYYFAVPRGASLPLTLLFESRAIELKVTSEDFKTVLQGRL